MCGTHSHMRQTAEAAATAASSRSSYRFQIGAAVVSGGRVLATACNRPARVGSILPSIHAEAAALTAAVRWLAVRGKRLRRHKVFVARGDANCSRSCTVCCETMSRFGTARVSWTEKGAWTTPTSVACCAGGSHLSTGWENVHAGAVLEPDDGDDDDEAKHHFPTCDLRVDGFRVRM